MTESYFSPSWYRVSKLKPRLRGHTQVYRHQYRGEVWFVLQDHAKGRYYRLTPTAYDVVGQMNGARTVQEVWESAANRLGDDAPTQGEIVQLLSRLHTTDVLLCDVPPDADELLRRTQKVERKKWAQRLRSPLAIRLPLIDPDRFLSETVGLVRPLFTAFGAILWLAVVVSAAVLAAQHWSELTANIVDRVLSAQNLLVMALAYPLIKTLHELGHGYAVKAWGGEVHDMGIIFLVFMPIPYVDASAAAEFRSKHRRIVVGAAGILVELFLAALALFVWLSVDTGLVRSLAYNMILIGGVSTLFFNGNPLLRYDGYYVLSDLLEIPNLAQRGTQYLGFLFKRYVLGIKKTRTPDTAPGEPFWFVTYSTTAFIYRLFIYTAIILFVAGKFFTVGILIAIWFVVSVILRPLFKGLKFLATSPVLQERRPWAILLTAAVVGALLLFLFVVPFPLWTRAEGVIWVPEDSVVRARTNGFVSRMVAAPNTQVDRGELLLECSNPLLESNAEVLRAQLDELNSRYDAAFSTSTAQAKIIEQEMIDVQAALSRAEELLTELEVLSPSSGMLVLRRAEDLPDRFFRQGELIGFVIDLDRPTVRVVVPQARVDLVRERTERVEVRFVERLEQALPAEIRREVPEAADRLPSPALGTVGGGKIAIDPSDQGGTKTLEKVFHFDLLVDETPEKIFVGSRVYVRFDHGSEPVAFRIYRRARQVLLRRLNV